MPGYAFAVANSERFQGSIIRRGGIYSLKYLPHRYLHGDSEREGFLVEHLAMEKKSNRWSFAKEAIPERIQKTVDHILAIDDKIWRGEFSEEGEKKSVEPPAVTFQQHTLLLPPPADELEQLQSNLFVQKILLSAEQLPAIDTTKNVVLTAGAGSGKTRVMVNRIVSFILSGEDVRSLVAVTFTEKAAFELRERVESTISEVLREKTFLGSSISPLELTRCSRARILLHQASIGTIHSFCQRIARPNNQRSEEQNIVQGAERDRLISQSVEKVVSSGEVSVVETIRFLLEHGKSPVMIREQLERLTDREAVLRSLKRSFQLSFESEYAPRARISEELLQTFKSKHCRF